VTDSGHPGRADDPALRSGSPSGRPVQGTVATYDAENRSGSVLLDDGTRLAFAGTALEGTGLRLLRSGQRVRLELEGEVVRRVQLLTLR